MKALVTAHPKLLEIIIQNNVRLEMKKLTKLQAYNAMVKLFIIYYYLDPSGDIGCVIGCMSFLKDKTTVDDAMWEVWGESLDIILKHKNLRNYNHLTPLQAFLAMGVFLEDYFGTTNLLQDIAFLESNVRLARDKKFVDPTLWKNWLQCVDEVLSVKDSRTYFRLQQKN